MEDAQVQGNPQFLVMDCGCLDSQIVVGNGAQIISCACCGLGAAEHGERATDLQCLSEFNCFISQWRRLGAERGSDLIQGKSISYQDFPPGAMS